MQVAQSSPRGEERAGSAQQARMDLLIGYLLLGGVVLSLALIAAGLVWRWIRTGKPSLDYQLIGTDVFQLAVHEIRLATHGAVRPRLLDTSGIVVLMLTPYLRVVASVAYFLFVVRNWKYAIFTSIVLTVLTYSLFLR